MSSAPALYVYAVPGALTLTPGHRLTRQSNRPLLRYGGFCRDATTEIPCHLSCYFWRSLLSFSFHRLIAPGSLWRKTRMSGLGGLNKSTHGVVLGLVQLQLPVVQTPADLAHQTAKICAMVAKARRNMPSMDLVVFPEYALHGLSMDTNPQ